MRRVLPAVLTIVVGSLATALAVFRLDDRPPPVPATGPTPLINQVSLSPLPEGPQFRACAERFPVAGDVDGDGQADLVFNAYRRPYGPAFIGVCTAAGETDRLTGTGMGELLLVGDVELDGREEIFFGGTTVAAQIAHVVVFLDGKLRYVRLENREPLTLVDGQAEIFDPRTYVNDRAWGCEDVDDDGRREVVQVKIEREGEGFRWRREVYRRERLSAVLVSSESGIMTLRDDELIDAARSLTSPCDLRSS